MQTNETHPRHPAPALVPSEPLPSTVPRASILQSTFRRSSCLLTTTLLSSILLLTALLAASAARADDRPLDKQSILGLQWENDIFTGRGTDRHYTNGLRFSLLRGENEVPSWVLKTAHTIPWFPEGGRVRGSWALGQNLFTPENIETPELVVDDRPYAAWLYLGTGLVLENGRILDVMELSLGVVGPLAQGEEVQTAIHQIIDSPPPQGWANQIPNELAIQSFVQRKWRQLHEGDTGLGVDLLPHLGGALGNVYVYGAAGAMGRVGFDLPGDYGPPRIQPGLPGSEFFLPSRKVSAYLFLGAEARAVLHNIFLDGSLFTDSHSVEKKWLVADFQGGIALVYRALRLTYTFVVRTEEFQGQDGGDAFGAFTLSIRL